MRIDEDTLLAVSIAAPIIIVAITCLFLNPNTLMDLILTGIGLLLLLIGLYVIELWILILWVWDRVYKYL